MTEFYDKNGNSITMSDWGELSRDRGYKFIGDDTLHGLRVSTVWLGLNHGFLNEDIEIFETMVFPEGEWSDLYCKRYTTEAEAIVGHSYVVQRVKDGERFEGNE